jgi:hypothetical protein
LRLAKNATQISYYESEKEKARCAFEEAELQLRILTDFYKEINDAELLLTKRLMELEKEMGEL